MRRLNTSQRHIQITRVANAGSRSIALSELLLKGHLLKRHIVIAVQAMYLACYTRRQQRRQELNLETILEGQPEGPGLLGGELEALVAVVNLDQFFVPI
jgi:hypothetical protein